jgi:hypothetical protein
MSRRTQGTIPSPEETAAVLAVSPLSADLVRLREILSQGTWNLHEASNCCEALAFLRYELRYELRDELRGQRVQVLLCERDQADGTWEDLLKAAAKLPDPPNLIVFSRVADESLWAKVLNLGGFDVLMTPLEPEEVLRVAFAAWSRWEYDYAARTARKAGAAGHRKTPARSAGKLVEQ